MILMNMQSFILCSPDSQEEHFTIIKTKDMFHMYIHLDISVVCFTSGYIWIPMLYMLHYWIHLEINVGLLKSDIYDWIFWIHGMNIIGYTVFGYIILWMDISINTGLDILS